MVVFSVTRIAPAGAAALGTGYGAGPSQGGPQGYLPGQQPQGGSGGPSGACSYSNVDQTNAAAVSTWNNANPTCPPLAVTQATCTPAATDMVSAASVLAWNQAHSTCPPLQYGVTYGPQPSPLPFGIPVQDALIAGGVFVGILAVGWLLLKK
jgi:hypothetical protein